MPNYRRRRVHGGTYFFTLVSHRRRNLFDSTLARHCLRGAVQSVRTNWPFEIEELVLLPDHVHLILTLPEGDADFSNRIGSIKSTFTRTYLDAGGSEKDQSDSRAAHRYRGIWQQRFWEHQLRDSDDLAECRKYCWYNPVKHGLVRCPHQWPYSTFHRAVLKGRVELNWSCTCVSEAVQPKIRSISGVEMH